MMPMSTTTASVTVSSWSNTGSARRVSQSSKKKSIDEAIDEYAQRSLQRMAGGDDYYVDDALGSYVTSCIRRSIGSSSSSASEWNIAALPEYEPLCELIQEHCPAMDMTAITVLLQTILNSIVHRQLPEEEEAVPKPAPASSYAPSQVYSVPSEPHVISPYSAGWNQEEEEDDQAPELRPSLVPTSPSPPSTLRDNLVVTRNAASTFDPTRSVEEEEESASYSSTTHPTPAVLDPALRRQKQDAYRAVLDQQRREYQVADRLFRAGGISHAAAVAAAALAQGNGPVAQYLLHQAAAQVSVCRHLLTDGCYRADCAFSHDIARHTCLFWMKATGCAKGDDCRFLHGFSEVLLEHMPEEYRSLPNKEEDDDWEEDEDYDAPVHIPSSQHSFANIASQGYHQRKSYPEPPPSAIPPRRPAKPPTVPIPQHLWQPHRDPSAFGIADPLERYYAVAAMWKPHRPDNVMDLHYQSLQTFPVVLDTLLPELLLQHTDGVWIITGTGHHVAERGHQKRHVSTLEAAVWEYLQYYYYSSDSYRIAQGRDRNGHGGALFLQKL